MPNVALFSALKPHQVAQLRLATTHFAEITTIHSIGNPAIREAAAVLADFPVIAAADPLGGAAARETAAIIWIFPAPHYSSFVGLLQKKEAV